MHDLLSRHAGIVIALSAVLTGAALWALLVTQLSFTAAEAILVAGLTLLSLAQLHLYRERTRASNAVRHELQGIVALVHDLTGDMNALRDNVNEMRQRIGEKNFLHAEKIANQVEAMNELVDRLEQAHEERRETEERIARQVDFITDAAKDQAAARLADRLFDGGEDEEDNGGTDDGRTDEGDGTEAAEVTQSREPGQAKEPPGEPEPARPRRSDLAARVAGAISGNRIDLYLQPIVTLPQRKVRYYEALTRLRDEEGHIIAPGDYLPAAQEAGAMTEIDNTLLMRSITLVRRLMERRREAGVFCNIAASTLLDPQFFPQFIELMEQNRQLAPSLIFEFEQPAIDDMGPLEEESLRALSDLGFSFSLDHVRGLDLDFERLAALGFRYAKTDATMMLDAASADTARVHPEDMSKLAQRFGIEMIAEKIESEKTVVNILDFDIRLAQGYLFARPRLVREEGGAGPFRAAA